MKKHLSVFGLYARSSFTAVIIVMLLLSAVQSVLFVNTLQSHGAAIGLAGLMENSSVHVSSFAGLVLVTFVLFLQGCKFGSQTGCTMRRLQISEKASFFWQASYNSLVYLLYFAVQLCTVYGLSLYYLSKAPEELLSNQTVFLAFYQNTFLHSLLPLSEMPLWIRNVLLIPSLGYCAAEFPYRNRRGKFSFLSIALLFYIAVFFRREIGDVYLLSFDAVVALLIVCRAIWLVLTKGEAEPCVH